MEYIHKKKAEKARSKMLQDQVKYIIVIGSGPIWTRSSLDFNILTALFLYSCISERVKSFVIYTDVYYFEIHQRLSNLLSYIFSFPWSVNSSLQLEIFICWFGDTTCNLIKLKVTGGGATGVLTKILANDELV